MIETSDPDIRLEWIPMWLRKRLTSATRHQPEAYAHRHYRKLMVLMSMYNGAWLDHWGTMRRTWFQMDEVFVTEPYQVGPADIVEIADFSERLELEFLITGGAEHNRGCVRIGFWPREERTR